MNLYARPQIAPRQIKSNQNKTRRGLLAAISIKRVAIRALNKFEWTKVYFIEKKSCIKTSKK